MSEFIERKLIKVLSTLDCKLEWRDKITALYIGKLLYLGDWEVGGVYNHMTSRGFDMRYSVRCELPGLKHCTDIYDTFEEAEERLNILVRYWLRGINAQIG
jgi:hypothetical protein